MLQVLVVGLLFSLVFLIGIRIVNWCICQVGHMSLQITYDIIDKVLYDLTVECSAETVNSTQQQFLHRTSQTAPPATFRLDIGSVELLPSTGTIHNTTYTVSGPKWIWSILGHKTSRSLCSMWLLFICTLLWHVFATGNVKDMSGKSTTVEPLQMYQSALL